METAKISYGESPKAPLPDAYLQYLAGCVTDDRSLHDDLVQEGRIKAWQAWAKEPDKPRQYYVVAVKRRMIGLCSGRERPTGYAGRRGYVDAMSPKHPYPESVQEMTEDLESDDAVAVLPWVQRILTETPFELLDRMPACLVGLVG